jgi:hypothetical protein
MGKARVPARSMGSPPAGVPFRAATRPVIASPVVDRRFVWAAAVVIVLASTAIALSLPYRPCAGAFTDTCRPPEEASGYTRFEPDWPVRWAVIGGGVVLALLLLGVTSRFSDRSESW